MRRIAILTIGLFAALPAFSQAPAAPAAAAAAAAPTGPHPKSAEENAALLEMFKAQDPDTQIKTAQNILDKFPDTDYKSQTLLFQAQAYHTKRDDAKAIVAGEKSLEADSKNYETLLLLAEIYSRTARSTDLDMEDQLAKSDKYAHDALTILAAAVKPKAEMPDADWARAKQGESSRAWIALGFSSLLRKKYDDAKTNFEKAVTLNPDPLDMLYIERAYTTAKRYDDALSWIAKVNANPNAEQYKKYVDTDKTRIEALKKQGN